jgi:hypothetical protein
MRAKALKNLSTIILIIVFKCGIYRTHLKLVFPVLPQDFWFGKSTSFFEQPKLNYSTLAKWRFHLIDFQ